MTRIVRIIFLTAVFLSAGGGCTGNNSHPTYYSTDIDTSEAWSVSGNPHVVTKLIEVGNGATLTIDPGCVVRFDAGAGIRCGDSSEGAVVAKGTSSGPIFFTSNAAAPAPGDWKGLAFSEGTLPATELSCCTIEYADSQAVLTTLNSVVKVHDCTVRASAGYGFNYDLWGRLDDFHDNTVTGCANYPVHIAPDNIRFLGTGNVLTGNAVDGIQVDGGSVSKSGLWRDQGVPYVVTAGVDIGASENPVVTIEPHTTVKFLGAGGAYAYLSVGNGSPGGLVADGGASPIVFTSGGPTPAPGDWFNIYFMDQAIPGQCVMKNCLVEYGGRDNRGTIVCESANPAITGCTIRKSMAWGIYLTGTASLDPNPSTLEANNTFSGNVRGNVHRP